MELSELEEILDPGEFGTLPDRSKLTTTEQILFALTEKQTRLAKHLKYSAAAQFAYQSYATDVNASTINTPKALLGIKGGLLRGMVDATGEANARSLEALVK